jgi:hypothetical protein
MKIAPHMLLVCTVAALTITVGYPASTAHAETLTAEQVLKVLKTVDNRQRNNGDYTAQVIIDQREKDKNDLVYDATVYRRDKRDRLMILMSRAWPKNLWAPTPGMPSWDDTPHTS